MASRIRAKEKARRWISKNALIAHTKTTGFAKHDEVREVAVVNSLGETVFHEFVKPTVPINSSAMRVHGISERQVAQCCCWDSVHDEFRRSVEGSQLVFYNASFDKRLLTQTINKFGLRVPDELTRAECAMLEYKSNCISRSSKFGWNRGGIGSLRVRAGFASSRLRRVRFVRFR